MDNGPWDSSSALIDTDGFSRAFITIEDVTPANPPTVTGPGLGSPSFVMIWGDDSSTLNYQVTGITMSGGLSNVVDQSVKQIVANTNIIGIAEYRTHFTFDMLPARYFKAYGDRGQSLGYDSNYKLNVYLSS